MEYPVAVKNFPLTYRSDFEADSPIVKVALRLAQKAHEGVSRGKRDPSIPYIIHPIMVHDLLQHFGEKNPMVLAAALLHDAIEDYAPYRSNPDALYDELRDELQKEGVADYKSVAHYISSLCYELTNKEKMTEGKRTWQIEHVGTLSESAARIKILDQTASELDSIVMPEPADRDRDHARTWSYKALNVVKSAAKGRPNLDFWRDLHKTAFSYNMGLTNAPSIESENQQRAQFDFAELIQRARSMRDRERTPIETTVDRKPSNTIERGLVQIGFDAEGNVAGFALLTNLVGLKDDPVNATNITFVGMLEASSETTRVTIDARDYVNDRVVRMNYLKPPMSVDNFIRIAKNAGALEDPSQAFMLEVRKESAKLREKGGKA